MPAQSVRPSAFAVSVCRGTHESVSCFSDYLIPGCNVLRNSVHSRTPSVRCAVDIRTRCRSRVRTLVRTGEPSWMSSDFDMFYVCVGHCLFGSVRRTIPLSSLAPGPWPAGAIRVLGHSAHSHPSCSFRLRNSRLAGRSRRPHRHTLKKHRNHSGWKRSRLWFALFAKGSHSFLSPPPSLCPSFLYTA